MEIFVDYKEKRKAFNSLIEPNCEKRIILFTGKSGMGKSELLSVCRKNICKPISLLPIQFHGTAVDTFEIFWRAGDCIGWDNLPEFTKTMSKSSSPIVNLSDINFSKIKTKGNYNQINVILKTQNTAERAERQSVLTGTLFKDLHKLNQCLLIVMDTYEEATIEVKKWINGPFLMRATNNENIRVAIAGKEVPNANTIDWGHCSKTYELNGVWDVEDWLTVVEALNREVPKKPALKYLTDICNVHDGRPQDIKNVIMGFPHKS